MVAKTIHIVMIVMKIVRVKHVNDDPRILLTALQLCLIMFKITSPHTSEC